MISIVGVDEEVVHETVIGMESDDLADIGVVLLGKTRHTGAESVLGLLMDPMTENIAVVQVQLRRRLVVLVVRRGIYEMVDQQGTQEDLVGMMDSIGREILAKALSEEMRGIDGMEVEVGGREVGEGMRYRARGISQSTRDQGDEVSKKCVR